LVAKPLIGFGLAVFLGGLLFHFYNDAITEFFSKYIVDVNDDFYLFSDLIWDMIPFIIILLGIVCLVFGSLGYALSSKGGD